MEIYLQGFMMGLAYVAPIGVQNLFVINSALTQRRSKALFIALIVIFFDISLAFSCFFGVGLLIDKLEWLKLLILLLGSLIIIYIGLGLLKSKDTFTKNENFDSSLLKVITSACVVTWFNPQAIIDGSLMLGAFRASLPINTSIYFILGVASASITWFLSITILTSFFKNLFNDKILRTINIVCGLIVIFYGTKLLISFYNILIIYL